MCDLFLYSIIYEKYTCKNCQQQINKYIYCIRKTEVKNSFQCFPKNSSIKQVVWIDKTVLEYKKCTSEEVNTFVFG